MTCTANGGPCQYTTNVNFPWCCSDFCLQQPNTYAGYCTTRPTVPNNITPSIRTPIELRLIPAVLVLLVLVAAIGICIWYQRHRNFNKNKYLQLGGFTKEEIRRFLEGDPETVQIVGKEAHEIADDIPYDRRYEVLEKSFTIDEKSILGSGAYGLVLKGKLCNQDVAIKMIKPNAEKSYVRALLTELKVLIHIGQHDNLVSLLGAYTSNLKAGSVYIFLELCAFGNLLEYLRNHRECFSPLTGTGNYDRLQLDQDKEPLIIKVVSMTTKDLLIWSAQIANGLRFLSDKKVIHGDIAARNILLFSRDQVKLTDFGLSRRLYEYANYVKKHQEPLPWRWMSIEALRDLSFSTQSDIWSFGVTLWEIFSLGQVPYAGLNWTQDFVYRLQDGYRLMKPIHAENDLYDLMALSWSTEPRNRPSFHQIYTQLCEINQKYTTVLRYN